MAFNIINKINCFIILEFSMEKCHQVLRNNKYMLKRNRENFALPNIVIESNLRENFTTQLHIKPK